MFKNGQPSATDEKWSTSAVEGNIEQIHVLILDNRKVIISEVANQLQINHDFAY
jgi:hypothetical protein